MAMKSQVYHQAALLVASSLLISGCSSTKDEIIPNDGVPIEQVYFGQSQTSAADANQQSSTEAGTQQWVVKRHATEEELNKNPYVLHNTLTPVFRKLDNPTLYIFSFPYLSDSGRVPVPAYISEMKMFERDEYALPGEVNLNMGGRGNGAL